MTVYYMHEIDIAVTTSDALKLSINSFSKLYQT